MKKTLAEMRLCLEMWEPTYLMLKVDAAGGYLEVDTTGGSLTYEADDPKSLFALARDVAKLMAPRAKAN